MINNISHKANKSTTKETNQSPVLGIIKDNPKYTTETSQSNTHKTNISEDQKELQRFAEKTPHSNLFGLAYSN